ncbi:MAG: hypothetical protein WCA35_04505, partial [Kovacikia sp.]
ALNPRILERIPRSVVQKKYLPAIRRGVTGGLQRVIPIVGPAGYGKSTILGHLYDELSQTETPWIGLILCSTLSLSTGFVSFTTYSFVAATFVSPSGGGGNYDPTVPSAYHASMLETGFGNCLCGTPDSIVDVAKQLTATHGRGVLLIDTLDLVINRHVVPPFAQLLRQLLEQGVTVVFTCRDHEYNDYLEPTREKLIGLSQQVDRYSVPNFTTTEIREAAEAFFCRLEPTSIERGRTFADNILALSADNRSLQEIIQNPLLLALLCDLFGEEGNVPPDLTVSKLYQRYWQEKIAYSRLDQRDSVVLAMEKENLCLEIARVLFNLSQERLCESVYRDELGIQFTDIVANAFNDLRSEGVIDILPSRKLHFFHQTLLEYAIAYWLTRHSAQAQRDQLLARLNQPDASFTRGYWLPVLRQLLTIVDTDDEFEHLVAQLNVEDMGIFGVIAIAAASRDRPEALRNLLPTALKCGEAYQRRLRQALGVASKQLIENTWDILLTVLQEGEHATAGNTAQLAGDLISRWWSTLKVRLPETLTAISRRSSALAAPEYQAQGDRALLLGWLLQPCLPLLEQTPDSFLLDALQQHLDRLGYRTCAAVIQLHAQPNIPEPYQQILLQNLISRAVPNHESVERALCDFVAAQLPPQSGSGNFPLGNSWSEILYQSLPQGWDVVQAKAVGRWAAWDRNVFVALLHEYLSTDEEHLRRQLIALTESLDQGAAPALKQHLLQRDVESWTAQYYRRLSPLLIRSARSLSAAEQEQLAQWLQPQVREHIQHLHPALDMFADASPTARQALEQSLDNLSSAKQTQVRNQLLRFQPIEQHPPLAAFDQAAQKFLIGFYRQQAATAQQALERLLQASQGRIREVALLASLDLDQVGGLNLEPLQLFPLMQSIFPGVRANALIALTNLAKQNRLLKPEEITHLCQLLSQEDNQTVARHLCVLTMIWVRQQQQVPPGIVAALDGIPARLLKQNLFEGGTARAMMDALKAIAQSEDKTFDPSELGRVVRELLTSIPIVQVRNSEAELIDLLSAMNRLDLELLSTIVNQDCPLLAQRGWLRNISAVVKTIQKVDTPRSPLLDTILELDWCTSELRSIILEVRGG